MTREDPGDFGPPRPVGCLPAWIVLVALCMLFAGSLYCAIRTAYGEEAMAPPPDISAHSSGGTALIRTLAYWNTKLPAGAGADATFIAESPDDRQTFAREIARCSLS